MSDDLAQGFAQHIELWSLQAGATPEDAALAARAALALSLAVSEGHVCLALEELDDAASLRARLPASPVVGTPRAPLARPLILDGDRLYLHRYFDLERRLARRLVQAHRARCGEDVAPRARALLRELFAGDNALLGGESNGQQLAAALALRATLLVVSGGPGTGKTSLVARLLGCLLAQAPESRIALAAPTGKAAARLAQALREHGARLPPDLRARLPTQATTVHRLLGGQGGNRFTFHAGHRLPLDVLVVDEASMLALPLAARLLEALPPTARIVLLGDKDQLAAVEAGAVFAEISADPSLSPERRHELAALCGADPAAIAPPPALRRTGLTDDVVWLRRNFRFRGDSPMAQLAQAVSTGQEAAALALLHAARAVPQPGLGWRAEAQAELSTATQRQLLEGYNAYLQALRRDPHDVAAVTSALSAFRVLAALREGPRGVAVLDALVAAWVRQAVGADAHAAWYPGRAVLVTRNDEALRLFNGDIGIALPDAGGALRVMFQDETGFRAVPPGRLPPHQGAFALTVHRAQGSEFDAVMLVLPQLPARVLSRELLYTGLTRARVHATLVGSAAVVASAIHSPTRRSSGLLQRLREELGILEA